LSFDLAVEHLDGTVLVCPIGELDSRPPLSCSEVLDAVIGGSSVVIVELSGLTFVDCAGLRPVRRALREGGSLAQVRLSGARPFVQRVLHEAGLGNHLASTG
jgi:anti-anti-sigma factor